MGAITRLPWYLFGLRQSTHGLYGRVNGRLQEDLSQGGPSSTPVPVVSPFQPMPPQEALQHTGTFVSVSYRVIDHFFWVFVCTKFGLCPPRRAYVSPSPLEVL